MSEEKPSGGSKGQGSRNKGRRGGRGGRGGGNNTSNFKESGNGTAAPKSATGVAAPKSASGGGGGGGGIQANRQRKGRHRARGNRLRGGAGGKSQHGSQSQQPRGPPNPPQLKVGIRDIHNAEKYGRMQPLLQDLVLSIVDVSNELLVKKMKVDMSIVQKHIKDEESAVKARQEWENRRSTLREEKAAIEENDPGTEDPFEARTDCLDAASANLPKPVDQLVETMQALTLEEQKQFISVRVMYAIPPRKTKRRGEKPGNVYLVLTTPPIEHKKPTPVTATNEAASHAALRSSVGGESSPPPTDQQQPPVAASAGDASTVSVGASSVGNPSAIQNNASAAGDAGVSMGGGNGNKKGPKNSSQPNRRPPRVDYSREIAQRRLWLAQALEAAQQVTGTGLQVQDRAAPHIASQPGTAATGNVQQQSNSLLGSCQVEEAMNVKTFKNHIHGKGDRLEGTVESSADFQEFMKRQAQYEQELKARPKPAPGGIAPVSSSTATVSGEPQVPVPAIVLHLQAKRQESKTRKKKQQQANSSRGNKKEALAKTSEKEAATAVASKKKKKARASNNKQRGGGGGKKTTKQQQQQQGAAAKS